MRTRSRTRCWTSRRPSKDGWRKWSRNSQHYVGFDATQKVLAGCFVSIGHDGSLFLDKGLVKPEHRKLLAKLLGEDDGKPVRAKPKHALPESLRRDLAADRLEVAQVAIARNPEIALDLLTFKAASAMIGKRSYMDGPDVEFRRPRPGKEREDTTARRDLAEMGKALPTGWLKATSEAEQFEAFRTLLAGRQAPAAGLLHRVDAQTEAWPRRRSRKPPAMTPHCRLPRRAWPTFGGLPKSTSWLVSTACNCWRSAGMSLESNGRKPDAMTRSRRWSMNSTGLSLILKSTEHQSKWQI